MNLRLVWPALVLLAVFVGTDAARAGGAPPAEYVRGPLVSAWSTVIRVGEADALAIDLRGQPGAAKWAYVANGAADTVTKFGTGGRKLKTWSYGPVTRYTSPVALAVGGSGNVFVADGARRRVLKFDPYGRRLAMFAGFGLPDGITIDRAGNVFVADLTAQQIVKLSPSGAILARWHVPWVDGTGAGQPRSVAVDRGGSVFAGVDCFGDACPPPHGIQAGVVELSALGALGRSLLGNNPYTPVAAGEQPFVTVIAVAVDRRGALYVGGTIRMASGEFRQGILVYGPGLTVIARYLLPGSGAPTGIAFDGRNDLYVAQVGRVLERLP